MGAKAFDPNALSLSGPNMHGQHHHQRFGPFAQINQMNPNVHNGYTGQNHRDGPNLYSPFGANQHGANQHGANQHGANQHGVDHHGTTHYGVNHHGANQHGVHQFGTNQHGVNQHDHPYHQQF